MNQIIPSWSQKFRYLEPKIWVLAPQPCKKKQDDDKISTRGSTFVLVMIAGLQTYTKYTVKLKIWQNSVLNVTIIWKQISWVLGVIWSYTT